MKLSKHQTFEDYPYEDLLDYAGIDAIVTLDILKKLWPKLNAKDQYLKFKNASESYYVTPPSMAWELKNIKAEALKFIVDMEVVGMPYDVRGNQRMGSLMQAEIALLTDTIKSQVGNINLDSGKELGDLLFGRMGLKPPMQTKSGDDATSGEALEMLFEENPELLWLGDIQKRKNMASVYRSFIETYVEKFVKRDGCIHPEYNLHGTSSHRISSDNPNLLNLPRSCYQYDIRSLYVVPEGMVFLTMDFSSCEVKILAALSRDETMIKAIREGLDFHTFTASMISGIPYDEILAVLDFTKEQLADPVNKALYKKYKEMRQNAKATTFGILYGSSINGLAMKLGITTDEAEKLVEQYFGVYPRIKDFVASSHAMAKANHYVFTPFGQRKQQFATLPCYKGMAVANAALRNAQNVLIQSTASTLGLMAFTEVNKRIKALGGRVMCTVRTVGGTKTTLIAGTSDRVMSKTISR